MEGQDSTNSATHLDCGPSLWHLALSDAELLTGGEMPIQSDRRLYQQIDLPGALQLSQEQIGWLISTGQLNPIRIAGEVRFDSRELDALIDTYLQITKRKKNYVQ
jgi:hypothetical protein